MSSTETAKGRMRDQFEAAVIARMMEGGYTAVEIRVECLQRDRSGGYIDGSVDTYWHFWQASRAAMVIELPVEYVLPPVMDYQMLVNACREQDRAAIEAAGAQVSP